MLKEFWEAKKYTIQITAALTAIGAIFLNIALPTANIEAKEALMKVQFFWIIIIIISIIALLVGLIQFALFFERTTKQKYNIDFDFGISLSLFFLSTYLLFNLIKYSYLTYFPIVKKDIILPLLFGVTAITTIALIWPFFDKYIMKTKMHFIIKNLLLSIAAGSFYLLLFLIKKPQNIWLLITLVTALILFFFLFLTIFYLRFKNKK